MRDSFIFYRSFYEAIKELPRDVQGEVYTAIMEYSLYGKETENLKPIARSVFTLIKPQIDVNNKRFENGCKGGRPKKNKTKEEPSENQNKTKEEPNVNVNDNVNVNNNNTPCNPPAGDRKVYEEFERFRKAYPGNKRGGKIEFDNFKKKHSDYRTAVFLLYPALEKLREWREHKKRLGQFVPEYANLSTWLNQRRWEVEFEKIEENETTETKRYDNGDFLR